MQVSMSSSVAFLRIEPTPLFGSAINSLMTNKIEKLLTYGEYI